MNPSRRQVVGTLAAAGAATLVDPGKVLARLAAEVPCSAPSANTLIGTLPLFRDRSQAQDFGVKISGQGLDIIIDEQTHTRDFARVCLDRA